MKILDFLNIFMKKRPNIDEKWSKPVSKVVYKLLKGFDIDSQSFPALSGSLESFFSLKFLKNTRKYKENQAKFSKIPYTKQNLP